MARDAQQCYTSDKMVVNQRVHCSPGGGCYRTIHEKRESMIGAQACS